MLIKSVRIRTSSGFGPLLTHLTNGEDNEAVLLVQGTTRDLKDAVDDARRHNRTYCLRHIVVAPAEAVTSEQAFYAFNAVAAEFDFSLERAVIFEHQKPRASSSNFNKHWHLIVPEVDAVDGGVLSSSHNYSRQEKLSRLMEFQFNHQPILGAHHDVVIKTLRQEGHRDAAAWLSSAFPVDRLRPIEAFSTGVHQARKRDGIDVSIARQHVLRAWENSRDAKGFHARLSEHGLSARRGERIWIIETLGGEFVGRAHALAKVRIKDFTARMEKADASYGRETIRSRNDIPGNDRDEKDDGKIITPARLDRGRSERGSSQSRRDDGQYARSDVSWHPADRSQNTIHISDVAGATISPFAPSRAQCGVILTYTAISERQRLSDLNFRTLGMKKNLMDKILSELEDWENADRHAIAIAEEPLEVPDHIQKQIAKMIKCSSAWSAAHKDLEQATFELEKLEQKRPPKLLGSVTGSLKRFEDERRVMERNVISLTEHEKHTRTALEALRDQTKQAEAAWNKDKVSVLRSRLNNASIARKRIQRYQIAKSLMDQRPCIAEWGSDRLLRLADEFSSSKPWDFTQNLEIRTDLWGIGILPPRPKF